MLLFFSHAQTTELLGLAKNIHSTRPEPHFQILNNWLEDMLEYHVFRAMVIVIREDIIFDVRADGEFKLGDDIQFEKFMELASDPKMPVHLIVVPSPCYDDM